MIPRVLARLSVKIYKKIQKQLVTFCNQLFFYIFFSLSFFQIRRRDRRHIYQISHKFKTRLRPLHAFKYPFQVPSYPCFIPSLILYTKTTSYKALQSILTLPKRIFHPTLQNPVQSLTRPQMTVLECFLPYTRAYTHARAHSYIYFYIYL